MKQKTSYRGYGTIWLRSRKNRRETGDYSFLRHALPSVAAAAIVILIVSILGLVIVGYAIPKHVEVESQRIGQNYGRTK